MSKRKIISAFLVVFIFGAVNAFASNVPEDDKDLKMPDNVKAIVQNSCYGCHNTGSKNDKAKEALDFKNLDTLSKIKKIGAHKEIAEEVEENNMPPKKFLERFPDKALSDADKKVLIEWAKKEAEALVKGN